MDEFDKVEDQKQETSEEGYDNAEQAESSVEIESEAGDMPQGDEEPVVSKKRKYKGLMITGCAVLLLGLIVLSFFLIGGKKAMNSFQMLVKDDASYYTWVEKTNMEGTLSLFGNTEKKESDVLFLETEVTVAPVLLEAFGIEKELTLRVDSAIGGEQASTVQDFEILSSDVSYFQIRTYVKNDTSSLVVSIPSMSDESFLLDMGEVAEEVLMKLKSTLTDYFDDVITSFDKVVLTKNESIMVGETQVNTTRIETETAIWEVLSSLEEQLSAEDKSVAASIKAYFTAEDKLYTNCYVNEEGVIISRSFHIVKDDQEVVGFSLTIKKDSDIALETAEFENPLSLKDYVNVLKSEKLAELLNKVQDAFGRKAAKLLIDEIVQDKTNTEGEATTLKTEVILGQYKGIEITKTPVNVTEEDIDIQLSEFANNSQALPITDRVVVELGDIVTMDYAGTMDGVAFPGGSASDAELEIGSGSFIEGFEEQLIGVKVGETLDINLNFPDPYSNNMELSGKAVTFTVTIHSIGTKAITDEFIQHNTEATSVAQYREELRAELVALAEVEAENAVNAEIISNIVENSVFINLPQEMIDEFAKQMEEYYNYYASTYGYELEEFVVGMLGSTMEAFEQEKQSYAEFLTKQDYVLNAIADAENIVVSEEDYVTMLETYSKEYGYPDATEFELDYGGKEEVKIVFLHQKIAEFLISVSNIK